MYRNVLYLAGPVELVNGGGIEIEETRDKAVQLV